MADFSRLKTTLAYVRLGLVSVTAAIAPITGAAQELCGTDLFEGEPDAASLMNETLEFLDVLEDSGVIAFQGIEGRMSIDAARRALQDGVGSASLLTCVVDAVSIEFSDGAENHVIVCNAAGNPSTELTTGQLFCTSEIATVSQYLGSEA